MILAQVWEAIFAQTSTGHSIFSRAFQAQILLGCEASVPQLSKLVHNLHIHAKMGALQTKFKVKIYHGDWDQIFHTFKKWTFWHPLTQKLVKMVMPQYIEGGFMLFSKIHDSHSTTSDQISWLHSSILFSPHPPLQIIREVSHFYQEQLVQCNCTGQTTTDPI